MNPNPKSCINCSRLFTTSSTKTRKPKPKSKLTRITKRIELEAVKEISVQLKRNGVTTGQMNVSILDALTCLFPSSSILSIFPGPGSGSELEEFGMCMDCASVILTLYGAYFQLLNLSNVNSRMTQLIQQIQIWHSSINSNTVDNESSDFIKAYVDALRKDMFQFQYAPQPESPDFDSDLIKQEIPEHETRYENFVKAEPSSEFVQIPTTSNSLLTSTTAWASKAKDKDLMCSSISGGISTKELKEKLQLRVITVPVSKGSINQFELIIPELAKKDYSLYIANDWFGVPNAREVEKKNRGSGKPRYYCPVCSKRCMYKWEMGLHYISAHEGMKPERCVKCDFRYYDMELFKIHHCVKNREYRCILCGLGLNNSAAWLNHRMIHEEGYLSSKERKYNEPDNANDDIPKFDPLNPSHKYSRLLKQYTQKCTSPDCSDIFLTKWERDMHVKGVHENLIPDECETCSFKYFEDNLLSIHSCITKEARKLEGLKYRCNFCGKCHKLKAPWSYCRRSHDLFKCDAEGCNRSFVVYKFLKRHIGIKHSGMPKKKRKREPKVACSECGQLLSKSNLLHHVKRRHGGGLEKNTICHICGDSFESNAVLKTHMKYKHSTARPYKCPLCSVTFKGSQEVRTHWKGKIHTKEETEQLLKNKILPIMEPDENPILPRGSKPKTKTFFSSKPGNTRSRKRQYPDDDELEIEEEESQ